MWFPSGSYKFLDHVGSIKMRHHGRREIAVVACEKFAGMRIIIILITIVASSNRYEQKGFSK